MKINYFCNFSNCISFHDKHLARPVIKFTFATSKFEMRHIFPKIKKGQYTLVLRIRCNHDLYWNSDSLEPESIFKVEWKNLKNVQQDIVGVFQFTEWSQLMFYLEKFRGFRGMHSNCSFTNYNNDSKWMNLELCEPIIVNHPTDVSIVFFDPTNLFWKNEMYFDFIELQPVMQ